MTSPTKLTRESLRIALIDDDEDDCDLLQAGLTNAGFAQPLIHFEDAKTALDYFKYMQATGSSALHIVLLDMNMPFLDGTDALFLLREASAFRDLPVIILTASDDPAKRRAVAHMGIFRFLKKHYNSSLVISALDDFIGLYNHENA